MKPPRVGDLTQRLLLERPVDAPDDVGGATRSWVAVDTIWAALRAETGGERFEAEREESAIRWRVLMRWRPDVTAAMRLRLGERTFAIHSACDVDARRRFMTLRCEEIT